MAHYYTNNVDLKSEKTLISFEYKNQSLEFVSDNGVFSKVRVDYGSRVLLNAITVLPSQKTLLDVGCGYGTLGLSLQKANPWLTVEMVDVNERAVQLANESAVHNHIDQAHAYVSFAYENVKDCFDIIVSNPPIRAGKKVVFEILEKAYDHLNENGKLVIVIQKKQGAPSAKKKMEDVFGNCEVVTKDKGYFILKSKKNTDF